jgi:hypothetical protein
MLNTHFLNMSDETIDGRTVLVTVLQHAGAATTVHQDTTWSYEMQFDPVFSSWPVAAPFTVSAGDVLQTHCEWDNTTSTAYRFPDEMCVGFGFFLSDGSSSPTCIEGVWSEGPMHH